MVQHRFHKSSFRPHLIMGAERSPMLFLSLVCGVLVFTSMNWPAILVAAGLWFTCAPLLMWMGRSDPNAVGIYLRLRRYPGYIRPCTTPFRKGVGYRIARESRFRRFVGS